MHIDGELTAGGIVVFVLAGLINLGALGLAWFIGYERLGVPIWGEYGAEVAKSLGNSELLTFPSDAPEVVGGTVWAASMAAAGSKPATPTVSSGGFDCPAQRNSYYSNYMSAGNAAKAHISETSALNRECKINDCLDGLP